MALPAVRAELAVMDIVASVAVGTGQTVPVVDAYGQQASRGQMILGLVTVDAVEAQFSHVYVNVRIGKQQTIV